MSVKKYHAEGARGKSLLAPMALLGNGNDSIVSDIGFLSDCDHIRSAVVEVCASLEDNSCYCAAGGMDSQLALVESLNNTIALLPGELGVLRNATRHDLEHE